MKLVIVESPTKTKSLSKYLGSEYEILASMGHIRDLPKSKFGIEIIEREGKKGEFDFVPTYETMDGKEEQIRKLKQAAARADEIILASDPDREGEAIAWHVKESIKKGKFVRIAFHSITKEAILEALDHPRDIDMDLVDAQQARRFLDRIVGYKLSPILWKKVRRGLSAGRVQSVAVRLIVEREREIEAFKPDEYWQIKVLVVTDKKEKFWVELARIGGKKAVVADGVKAGSVVESLNTAQYIVTDVKKLERRAQPNPPFKTSTLQQAAANVLGWSAKKTMNIAQRLYEQGDITYHRTDSFNLAQSAIDACREFIKSEWGENYVSATPRIYKTSGKVVAQEAHEAVRPTHFEMTPEKYSSEEADHKKLYSLIWRRAMACQMAEAIFDDTRVTVKASNCELTAAGETVKFDGWKKLFEKDKKEEVILPEIVKDQELKKDKVESAQKFTQPPARFNDASHI